MRGKHTVLVLVICLLTVSIAGCVDEELSDPNINLQVRNAQMGGPDCHQLSEFQMDSGDRCHQIDLVLDNQNEQEDVDTDRFNWDATDEAGAVRDAAEVVGPDAVAAGGQAEFAILFAEPQDVTLQEIRFEAIWMSSPQTAVIPSYT